MARVAPRRTAVLAATILLWSGSLLVPASSMASEETAPRIVARVTFEKDRGVGGCPDERALQDALRAELGRDAIDPRARAHIHVSVSPRAGEGSDIDGHIQLTGEDGARLWANDLRAGHEDCKTLIASLALSLRVAVSTFDRPEQAVVERPRPDTSENGLPPTVIHGVSLPPPPTAESAAALRERARREELANSLAPPAFRTFASVAAAIGTSPNIATRVSINLGVEWPGVSFSAEARGMPPAYSQVRGYRLHLARWEAAFLPCFTRWIFVGCASVAAGGFWSQVAGPWSGSHTILHLGVGARGGAEWPITSRLGVLAYVDVEASLFPYRLALSSSVSFQESPLQVTLGIAVTGALPSVRQ